MLAFYMDHNIPKAVVQGLRQRQVDVPTAYDDARAALDDPNLFDRAQELGRVLFTHDKGFLDLARGRQRRQEDFVGLVFAQQQGFRIGPAIDDLELIAKTSTRESMRGTVLYIPISS